ncbi:hypothetical protein PR202_gb11482 [Eleusine coracana subsp. coracana]|uniref:Uncharacterized protein n=1 Tax=Eleusine coracana subsp. coracana TaxID=191504 RepID=A0AAV5EMM6_ELECO|nr:hypothetical protein PR202_gb11482 [Eleusine coracana subsp. coracana]
MPGKYMIVRHSNNLPEPSMETSNITVFSSPPSPQAAAAADIDAVSLGRLSTHLDSLLDPAFFDCTDAEIVLAAGGNDEAGGATVAVHRCILSARSSFFLSHFSSLRAAGEKPRLELAKLVPGGCHISRDALVAVLGYLYTGRLKPPPQEVVVCIDDDCTHESCRPAIDFIVESTYAASGFQISELVSLFQRSLLNFVDTASIEDMVPIIHAAVTCQISGLLDECIQRFAVSSTFNSLYLEKELPGDTYAMIKEIRRITFPDELGYVIVDPQHGKNIRNTHMALDSHDIDLVGMLLKESAVTLDDAFAVHYAATRCTPKVVSELLKLDSANTKRTCTSDLVTVEETVVTPLLVDNFHMKLIYFENRVAFARLFFPSEAKLAMCIAEADSTEEFTGTTLRKLKEVGLNEIPTMQNRRLRERLDALSKTVELGRRYFPNCSEVLDKFLHEESTDLDFLESGALEDRQVKRMRFYELKEDVRKAFDKDKAASAAVASTASSSSSPRYEGTGKRRLAFRKGSKIG